MVSRSSDVYPHPAKAGVTAVMKGNKGWDTRPESMVRSLLHREGYRFRKHVRLVCDGVVCKPDIVFSAAKVGVFIDGCFWHCCPEHGRVPGGRNAEYWEEKFAKNRSRDLRQTAAMEREGWTVLRIWEHVSPKDAVEEVGETLRRARGEDRR